jgi:3-dehydroquinate synthetase
LKSILDLAYPIYIEDNLHRLNDYVFKHVEDRFIYVITDDIVYNLHGKKIKDVIPNIKDVVIITSGESSKVPAFISIFLNKNIKSLKNIGRIPAQ